MTTTSDTAPGRDALQTLVDRALVDTGRDQADLVRLVALLEKSAGPLLGPVAPGTKIFLRLVRFLLDRGERESAARLFTRGGEAARALVQEVLDRYWPVGTGLVIDAHVGVTFGIPLQLSESTSFDLVRETRKTVKLVRHGVAAGGFDTGIGAGGFVRFGAQGVGASAGAQAQFGVQVVVHEAFEFPVLEDAGFVPLLVYLLDAESAVQIAAVFDRALLGLAPEPFRKKLKLEVKAVGSGVAGAEAGVRTADDASRRVSGGAYGREGKAPIGRGEAIFFDPKVDRAVNLRGALQALLRAALRGEVVLEAGAGLQLEPEWARDANGIRQFLSLGFELYAEGEAAGAITAVVAVASGLPAGPAFQGGGGLRLIWRIARPFDEASVEYLGHELYLKAGELDVYEGPAHEIVLSLPVFDLDAFERFDAFIAAIDPAVIRYRFTVGSPLGRAYALILASNRNFTVVLSPKYRDWGLHLLGYFTVELVLPEEVLTRMLARIGEHVLARLEADADVQALVKTVLEGLRQRTIPPDLSEKVRQTAVSVLGDAADQLRTFLDTGEVPESLQPLVDDLLAILVGAVREIEFRGEVGLGLAAGATVAKGGKIRVHGSVSGRVVLRQDVAPLIQERLRTGLLKTGELLELLRGRWNDAPAVVDVPPEALREAQR
ncbi:MAG TPA: hypothetical protein VK047_14830 [Zeimonas sp.]|nr:hypothetical protein [Zeimonas sp.]